ncbi:MAG: hypothetical protein OEM96_01660 [Gemmatimonadota bacterium]|nr:hypothetical protein [Gemmatimonadota bacterium]
MTGRTGIRIRKRHPGFFALSRYVDRGEDGDDLGGIRIHLRDCSRCRDEVAWIKRLRVASGRLREVQPPDGVLDGVLSRRAAGDRLILPLDVPPAPPSRRRGRQYAGALGGAAVLTIFALVLLTSRATAGSNNLTFTPRYPEPGDEISVRYDPTTALAGADSLRLRVRLREAGQPLDEEDSLDDYLHLTLLPDMNGAFHASFVPPAEVVYAQLAVEDTPGLTVDSNNRQLWEVVTYDPRGNVLYESLRQRQYTADAELNWRRRRETAFEMTRLFPDRAEGWYQRFLYELETADPANRDSVRSEHLATLRRLEFVFEAREVPAVDLAAMMDYADGLGERAVAAYWEDRLALRDPGNRRLLRRRAIRDLTSQPDQARALEAIDYAWLTSSPRDWNLAELGLDIALTTGRWERAETWARRLTGGDPRNLFRAGRQLVGHPETRGLGIEYLERAAMLAERHDAWSRPLVLDDLQYGRQRALRLQRILTLLADALVESGDPEKATAVIARAASLSWDPDLLRQLAERRLELGDTFAALDLLARAAADPLAGPAIEESGSDLVSISGLRVPDWLQIVADRREQLRLWMLEATDFRRLSEDVTVETGTGDRVPVRSLAPGQPTLVAVSALINGRVQEPSVQRFTELHARLSARAFPFVVLTTWGDRTEFSGFVGGHRPAYPVFHDPDNVAGRILGVSRVTEYLVLDADGVLRGTYDDLQAALRLLFLLPRPRQVA